ncbi:MAG: hydrogenase iron-sulfur subunit [Dehalococcoidia bacterium]|nr:MAG: hydrogenase iron-sulfur subunit [Dehalococcoidia bacterium]
MTGTEGCDRYMSSKFEPKIHVFFCVNALDRGVFSTQDPEKAARIQSVKMPCSSMIKDIFMLKAFECGADGVMVVGCPAGRCKRVDGNIRAAKRVAWVQKLLDEIGLGGKRLVYTASSDTDAAITLLLKGLAELGPNPVKPAAQASPR